MKVQPTSPKPRIRVIRAVASGLSTIHFACTGLLIALWLSSSAPLAWACDFQYDPVAIQTFYRTEGWLLPGVADFSSTIKSVTSGAPIEGAVAEVLSHHEDSYIVEFPAQEFVLKGLRQRMRPMQVKATIVRWTNRRHVIAYSYSMIPVKAYKVNGSWKVVAEVACVFTGTFIDDKGDGVFRVLVKGPLTTALIPNWVRRRERD